MAITTLTGLGSGLDIKNLVPALIEAEKAPKQAQINTQKARTDTQLSAVSMLKSALASFESSLLGLKSGSGSFSGYKAASSAESLASVTLKPIPATASKVASAKLVDGSATVFASGGTLTIQRGAETPHSELTIAAGATITQVRDAINSQLSGKGVSASIQTIEGSQRLVVSSSKTGAGNDLVISGTDDLAALNANGTLQQAADAAGYLTRAADVVQAQAGAHVLKVDTLAAASKVASALQAGGSTTQYASGGKLTIQVGAGGAEHEVDVAANASLEQIRDSINGKLSGNGISASIISDSSGARLVLSSSVSGAGNDITVTSTGTDLTVLDIDGTQQQTGNAAGWLTEAADAKFSIDGLAMTSKDNTFNGLQGLSIKLQEVGSTTVSVSANSDGIAGSVEAFVMAYNTLLTVTNGLTKVTQTTDKDGNATTQAGALVADSGLRSMLSQIRSVMASPAGGAGQLKVLADLGVSTNRDGTLALDTDKLKKTVAQDPTALAQKRIVALDPGSIQEFFTGEKGLINRIGDITTVYTSTGGLLASREKSLSSVLENLAKDQGALDRRIEKLTLSLFARFNAMDNLVARLTATSQSVMATLNALNNKKDD
ncbi:MAG TPA: flagellar filament capping protein FliD [Pseudomonas sp.]|nr:flagellar filament capping protein FliD [Pseudomonas sp.]